MMCHYHGGGRWFFSFGMSACGLPEIADGVLRVGKDALTVWTCSGVWLEVSDADGAVVRVGGDCGTVFANPGERIKEVTLPDPGLTAEQINVARRSIRREMISGRPYSVDIPETINGVIAWLQKLLLDIPEKCRDSAAIRFDTTTEYGETYPNVEAYYTDQETDEEVISRVKVERMRAEMVLRKEKMELKRLQEKLAEVAP